MLGLFGMIVFGESGWGYVFSVLSSLELEDLDIRFISGLIVGFFFIGLLTLVFK